VSFLTLCGLILVAAPAYAEEPPAAGEAAQTGEIIVTAQRRSERLQDVPISITAFTGEALDSRNITNLTQLEGLAPNVKITTYYSASPQIAIRGSVTTNPSPAYEPTVGLYVDGVYQGKAYASGADVADIEQMEVLRGPQGTLYGRNTLAGAVNIVTRKPTGEFGGNVKVGYGNYGQQLARFDVDLPAFGDFSLKLSGLYNKRDGFVDVKDNPYLNVAQARPRVASEADSLDKQAFRAALRFKPTDAFTADYTFDYGKQDNLGKNFQLTAVGKYDPARYDPVKRPYSADPASPSYFGGLVGGTYLGYPLDVYVQGGGRADAIYQSGGVLNKVPSEKVDIRAHALTLQYDLEDVTLKSISSYRTVDADNQINNTGTPLPILNSNLILEYKQYSQELQATGKAGNLNYTAGLYYFHDDANVVNPIEFFTTTVVDSRYRPKTDAYAVYGQVDYQLGDLTLTGGLRYSEEEKTITRSYAQVLPFVFPVFAGAKGKGKFDALTPTFVARYAFSKDLSVYAKYAEGFKSGGFNAESSDPVLATTPYKPEKVASYEVGAKGVFFDGALRANLAAFFNKHDDQQLTIFRATGGSVESQIQNAGKSEISGVELDFTARPVNWLSLTGSLGYLHAEYKEFFEIDYETGIFGNYAGQRAVPNAPELTASLSADATLAQGEWGDLHFIVDYTHSDPYFIYAYSTERGSAYDAYTTEADTSDIFDARLRLANVKVGSGKMDVALWGKNLTDADPRVWGIDYGPAFGNAVISVYAPPRTFGLEASYHF